MASITTESLRREILNNLIESVVGDSDTYYIAIGRSEQWNDSDIAPTPLNTLNEEENFRHAMQSIKIAEEVSLVVPRSTWSSGTIYSAFDDKVDGHPENPYFVITDENNVYVCTQRARNADGTSKTSTVKPTGTSTSKITTADGYTWQYLYSITTANASKFLTANFMPVEYLDSSENANDALQIAVQNAAVSGEILNIVVTNGGTGYTSAPTVVIEGDGTGAEATATVSGGQVKRIQMSSYGSGYRAATVSFTGGGGTGATARPVISPQNGIGANPEVSLRASAIMFNSKPSGTENGDFIIGNDFRQVGILRNPTDYSGTLYNGNTGLVLRRMTVADAAGFDVDLEITGTNSGSKAIIDYVDSDKIYFHQNDTTGFGSFDSDVGGVVSVSGASTTLSALLDSADVDPYSGELMYIENRSPVTRSETQTEDIKAIITL